MTYREWEKSFVKDVDKSGESGIIKVSGSFVNKNDLLSTYGSKIKPLDGYGDIIIHGSPNELIINGANGEEWSYNAKKGAEIIRNSKEFHGQPIRLISCQTGAQEDGIAQRIADELKVNVLAPTEVVNVDENGRMFVSDNDVLADIWHDASEEDKHRIKETGKWVLFKPRKE